METYNGLNILGTSSEGNLLFLEDTETSHYSEPSATYDPEKNQYRFKGVLVYEKYEGGFRPLNPSQTSPLTDSPIYFVDTTNFPRNWVFCQNGKYMPRELGKRLIDFL